MFSIPDRHLLSVRLDEPMRLKGNKSLRGHNFTLSGLKSDFTDPDMQLNFDL